MFWENIKQQRIFKNKKVRINLWYFASEKQWKAEKAFVKCLCGLNVKISDIIGENGIELSDEDKKTAFSFNDNDYDVKIIEIEQKIGENKTIVIAKLKEIHDKALLSEIMKGKPYLSYARVADYEKHAYDLKILKRVIKKYFSNQEYDNLFRSEENGTYSAYVNSYNSGNKSRRNYKERKQEDLYKNIKSLMKSLGDKH